MGSVINTGFRGTGSTEINHSFFELHFTYNFKSARFQSLASSCALWHLWSSSSVTEVSLQFLFSTRQTAIAVANFMLLHQLPFFCVTNIPDPQPTSQKLDWSCLLAEHTHGPSERSIVQRELPDEKTSSCISDSQLYLYFLFKLLFFKFSLKTIILQRTQSQQKLLQKQRWDLQEHLHCRERQYVMKELEQKLGLLSCIPV